jgi:chromosome segregation ATPase
MKKIMVIVVTAIVVFCPGYINGQTTAKLKAEINTLISQRDSIEALYKFTLDKYDSIAVANMEIEKKMKQTNLELASLKDEIETMLLKRRETVTALEDAKKLILELVGKVDELEAEVKRLKEPKKKQ